MKPFDPSGNCQRCGSGWTTTEFCAKTNNCGYDHTEPIQHRLCMNCGERWNEQPTAENIKAYNDWLIEVNKR